MVVLSCLKNPCPALGSPCVFFILKLSVSKNTILTTELVVNIAFFGITDMEKHASYYTQIEMHSKSHTTAKLGPCVSVDGHLEVGGH